MKRFSKISLSVAAAGAAIVMSVGGLATANAAEAPPLVLYPSYADGGTCQEGNDPTLLSGTENIGANEQIVDLVVSGEVVPGDVAFAVQPGTHPYTYGVKNTDTGAVQGGYTGSVTVEACAVAPDPITATAPSQSGQTVTIPSQGGVEYYNTASGAVLTGTVQVADGTTLTVGARATGEAVVNGGPWPFTYNAPDPEPIDPSISTVSLTPSSDGSGFDYNIAVNLGDSESTIVVISNGDTELGTVVFDESGPKTGSLDLKCGEYSIGVAIKGDSSTTKSYPVTITCANTDGNTGGGSNGGGTDNGTGNTGGSNSGTGVKPVDTKPVDTTKVSAGQYSTGDVVQPTNSPVLTITGIGAFIFAMISAALFVRSRRGAPQPTKG